MSEGSANHEWLIGGEPQARPSEAEPGAAAWLPDDLPRAAHLRAGADASQDGEWVADERALRARRLAGEMSRWLQEVSSRSEALRERLREVEAAR